MAMGISSYVILDLSEQMYGNGSRKELSRLEGLLAKKAVKAILRGTTEKRPMAWDELAEQFRNDFLCLFPEPYHTPSSLALRAVTYLVFKGDVCKKDTPQQSFYYRRK